MHDLYHISVPDRGAGPLFSPDDCAVQFDGDTFFGQGKLFEQLGHCRLGGQLSELAVQSHADHSLMIPEPSRA